MKSRIDIIKGVHPGTILEREINKRHILKSQLAKDIDEHPQTISAITQLKRRMNPELSIKLGKALGFDAYFFSMLQTYYDIEQALQKISKNHHPDLSKINAITFWDTTLDRIDWQRNKTSVIKRIFERGTDEEIQEIIKFYGKEEIIKSLKLYKDILPRAKEKELEYIN